MALNSPENIIRNTEIINLFCNLSKYNKNIGYEDNKSCCMNTYSILKQLNLAYYALDDNSINNDKKRALDKNIFNDMVDLIYKPTYLNMCLFLKPGYMFNKDFMENIILKGNDQYKLYKNIEKSEIPECFDYCNRFNISLATKCETKSYYDMEDGVNTTCREFFLYNGSKIYIPTICSDKEVVLQKYICDKTKSLVVCLELGDKEILMIIMPYKLSSKKELFDICKNYLNGQIISNYILKSKPQTYSKRYIPKISLESNWVLNDIRNSEYNGDVNKKKSNSNDNDNNYYLQIPINNNSINFSKIYNTTTTTTTTNNNNNNNHQYILSKSTIQNCKRFDFCGNTLLRCMFTRIIEKVKDNLTIITSKEKEILKINRSFIFIVLNKDNKNNLISNIGLFVGNNNNNVQ